MNLLRSSPTARDLARLLTAWLAVIVFVQAMAAAQGLAQGPRHRHLPATANADTTTARLVVGLALSHGELHRHHDGWQRHVHVGVAPSSAVVADDPQALGAVAAAALAALPGLPPRIQAPAPAGTSHVLHPARAWAASSAWQALPDRPPRG